MSERTKISWCDATLNVAWGCTKIAVGCKSCYALTLATRYGFDVWGADKPRRVFGEKHWREPILWAKRWAAERHGRRMRIFTSSMCDVFEDHPTIIAETEKLWPLIRATSDVDWLVLTKRPERMAAMLPTDLENVWVGTSISTQADADWQIPELLKVKARVRFLSFEPAIERVDLGLDKATCKCCPRWGGRWIRLKHRVRSDIPFIADPKMVAEPNVYRASSNPHGALCVPTPAGDLGVKPAEFEVLGQPSWVIVGGESGYGFREMPADVVPGVVAQCRAAGIPVFVKQDSGPKPGMQGRIRDEDFIQEFPR